MVNYKTCPLKKRPVVYVESNIKPQLVEVDDQPQDLSMKRKSEDYLESDAKRTFPLNLTSRPLYEPAKFEVQFNTSRPESPLSMSSESSQHGPSDNLPPPPLSYQQGSNSNNPVYNSAFVPYHLKATAWNTHLMYNTPAYASYQQMTPPSSPDSSFSSQWTTTATPMTKLEPEDLSIRSDIPLTALFHFFDEAPSGITQSPTHQSKSYRFKCDKCSKMYSTSIGLSKHQQYHCPAAECNQEKKQHECQECGKLYTTIGALKMHIRTHTLPCKCPICGKAFSRPWLLQGHIRTHTGEKPFSCTDCHRSFADRSNLRAHQQTHVDVKKYACRVCTKSFSRMSLLNKHANSNCTITIL